MWVDSTPKAFAYQLKAGQAALALYELGIARKHLQTAEQVAAKHLPGVRAADRLAYLVGLGDVCGDLGEPDCALAYYKQTFDLAQAVATGAQPPEVGLSAQDARRQAADIARRTGRRYGWMGQLAEAHRWMTIGRDLIDPPQDSAERDICALIDANSASLCYQEGNLERTEALAKRAVECAGGAGAPAALGEAYMMLGVAQDTQGRPREVLASSARSREIWASVPDPFQVARVEVNMAIAYTILGELPKAKKTYGDALRYFDERVGDRNRAATALTNLGCVNYIEGDYDAAAARHQRAILYAQELEIPWIEAIARRNLAWVHIVRGGLDAAVGEAERCLALETEHGMTDASSETHRILVHAAIGRSDNLSAQQAPPDAVAAELAQATAWAEKALVLAQSQGNLLEQGTAERLLGQIARRSNDLPTADAHLLRSLDHLLQVGDRIEIARTWRQLVWLSLSKGNSAQALSYAVRVLTTFVAMRARGEAALLQQGDRLRFTVPLSLDQTADLYRRAVADVGCVEISDAPAADRALTLHFRCEEQGVEVRLVAEGEGTVAVLSTD
jgi:tetratricopeptide (TPR) repeat protein